MPILRPHLGRIVPWLVVGLVTLGLGTALMPPVAPPEQHLLTEPVGDLYLEADAQAAEVVPIPHRVSVPPLRAELGRRLFHDRRLSKDNSVSCASCHPLNKGGMDGARVSMGVAGRTGDVNAPTVLNSGFSFRQFWDGRAADLEEQAAGPVHNPLEMATDWKQVLAKLDQDPALQRLAQSAYGRPLDAEVITSALATFQRTLVTPDSAFDQYLRGDGAALDAEAQAGWGLFRGLGCVACHQGINLGGNMYANLGVMQDFFAGRPAAKADLGRYNVTGREADKHLFKVPTLRNVARTAPYFHDGGVASLEEAVRLMARHQLGLELQPADVQRLVAFLRSLDGRLPT